MKKITKTILIVEDETALLEILKDTFDREGFNVLEAKDGSEGLKKALKNKPDLILLDIVMPTMDGITMIKKLREHKDGVEIPVLFLSNLTEYERVTEVLGVRRNIVDHLTKSDSSIEGLVGKVKKALAVAEK